MIWCRRHREMESDDGNSSFRTPILCSLLLLCLWEALRNALSVSDDPLVIWFQGREQRRDPAEGKMGALCWEREAEALEEKTGEETALQADLDLGQSLSSAPGCAYSPLPQVNL